MIKINVYLTTSKIAAYIILAISTVYAFYTKDAQVLIFGMSLTAGLLGLKSWSTGLTERKQIEVTPPLTPTPLPESGVKKNPSVYPEENQI